MKRKILVIDDDTIIRNALLEFLSAKGFEALTAENGEVGFHLFQREKPDLVILDLVMPVLSGVQCLEKIRAEDQEVPVVILTGYGTENQIQRLKDLGVSDIIQKGIGFEDFLALIEGVLERDQDTFAPASVDPSDFKVLVADDDAIIRTLLVEFLVSKGFRVLSAKDGDEAYDLIVNQSPKIVFLDLIMPRMDGKTIMNKIPEAKRDQIKWILITGHGYKEKEFKAIKVRYRLLQKPFSLETFKDAVVDILQEFSVKV